MERSCHFSAHKRARVPDPVTATVATVANGEVIFLPSNRQIIPGRPIIGAVFRARELAPVRKSLESMSARPRSEVKTDSYRSLFVSPADAIGIWLEFRELRP